MVQVQSVQASHLLADQVKAHLLISTTPATLSILQSGAQPR